MNLHVIYNPRSGRGRVLREWPQLEKKLQSIFGDFKSSATRSQGSATDLTRSAVEQGADWILAIGGDGTLNEVLNGFFDQGNLINPNACLSVLMLGTGGDFKRTLELSSDPYRAITEIAERPIRKIDLGRVQFCDHGNQTSYRYFINIASFGLGGEVSYRLNHSKFLATLGGKISFFMSTLQTLAEFKSKNVKLKLTTPQGELNFQTRIRQVAIANGSYQGGGMFVAPQAQLNDGLLDVVILPDVSLSHSLSSFAKVYQGQHLQDPDIFYLRASKLQAEALTEHDILLELDGETPGKLPAVFEVVPGAIQFKG